MTTTKTISIETYEEKAEMLKLMGHPVRLKMLQGLINGPKNVSTIQSELDLPQSTISQHLGKLKSAKIVSSDRKGLEIFYQVRSADVKSLVDVLL
ncbi:metalloregulator ArsR/SmtB family transcription factor [Bacillus toyonensis]|uniref:ArsR/SmtB family transcription factor n=1 Tax=Bacillus toyonensis TaxID=155322 RepID=UPI002E1F7529|nr:metalloregulator ArsR/SmtB family transcription factor [Bacillus toyonensis]